MLMYINSLTHDFQFQIKLRDRIYSKKMSMISTSKLIDDRQEGRSLPYEGTFWGSPESR